MIDGGAVIEYDKKYGYIDSQYQVTVKPKYSSDNHFYKGYAIVSMNGKYGFIDKTGNTIVDLVWDDITPMSDGVDYYTGDWGWYREDDPMEILKLDEESGAADLYFVTVEVDGTKSLYDDKKGVITASGKVIIPAQYEFCIRTGNYIKVFSDLGEATGGLYTFNGAEILPTQYDSITVGEDGWIFYSKGNKMGLGYITPSRTKVYFSNAEDFDILSDTLLAVEINSLWGLIDISGKRLVNTFSDSLLSRDSQG